MCELLGPKKDQKNPRVRKIRVRNSGAGNGCANFMDAWKNAFFLQEKPMSIKFLVLGGGGVFWVFFGGGGGESRFYFYGRADFSEKRQNTHHPQVCTRDVGRQFCGGGAWISRSDSQANKVLVSKGYAEPNEHPNNPCPL